MNDPNYPMSLRDAHATLRLHQAWRLGAVTNDMLPPSEVTKAINALLLFAEAELAKQEASNEG